MKQNILQMTLNLVIGQWYKTNIEECKEDRVGHNTCVTPRYIISESTLKK